MKAKQLEYLESLNDRHLSAAAMTTAPSLVHHIRSALVHSRSLRLLPAKQIVTAARNEMVNGSSYRDTDLSFSKIFYPPPSFTAALKEHQALKARMEKAVKSYRTQAESLLRTARFDEGADADLIAARLTALARKHGLNA